MTFKGATYDEGEDGERLTKQLDRVRALMVDGQWRTLSEIAAVTGDPEASISRQLRYLREPRNGGFDLNKQSRGDRAKGLYEYQITPGTGAQANTYTPLTKARRDAALAGLMQLVDDAARAGVQIPQAVLDLESWLDK